jgi:excisionase family DNA binding protein
MTINTETRPERLTLTVEEAAQLLGIGRSLAYGLVATGDLPSIRLGRRILIPRVAVDVLLTSGYSSEP